MERTLEGYVLQKLEKTEGSVNRLNYELEGVTNLLREYTKDLPEADKEALDIKLNEIHTLSYL